jgi:lysyl-tRNA synthetase class 2
MYPEDLKEQQIVRREKAQELKNKGIEPFGQKYVRTHSSKDLFDLFQNDDHDTLEQKHVEVSIAGRIMLKRGQGKAGDQSGGERTRMGMKHEG